MTQSEACTVCVLLASSKRFNRLARRQSAYSLTRVISARATRLFSRCSHYLPYPSGLSGRTVHRPNTTSIANEGLGGFGYILSSVSSSYAS